MKKVILLVLAGMSVFLSVSCTGKQGAAGLVGPAGPQQPGLYYIRMFQAGVYSPTYNGQAQSAIYGSSSSSYYTDSNNPVKLGVNDTLGLYRSLFRFDISALPISKIVVDKAELTFKTNGVNYGGGAQGVKVHKLTAAWNINVTSWSHRTNVDDWTSLGGDFSTNTITPNAMSVNILPDSTTTIALDPAVVQGWMENPATNYGVLLKVTDETVANYCEIYSSGAVVPSNRPMLKVWYYTVE